MNPIVIRDQAQVFPGININRITIGVELEMVVFNLPSGTELDVLIRDALAPVALRLPYSEPREEFEIKDDCSIETNHPTIENLQGVGIEVATPILRGNVWVWLVPAMCEAIISGCSQVGAFVDFNASTGLHVHIALGEEYTLTQLKKIARAVILFEGDMDYHHPPHRRPDPEDLLTYYGPCRMSPALAGYSTLEMIDIINLASTNNELLTIINGNRVNPTGGSVRVYAYNFCAIRKFGTIEFRQGDATDDAEVILTWITNIVKFISSAVQTPRLVYSQWAALPDGVTDPEILSRFGIPPLDPEPPLGPEPVMPRSRVRKRDRLIRVGTSIANTIRRATGRSGRRDGPSGT